MLISVLVLYIIIQIVCCVLRKRNYDVDNIGRLLSLFLFFIFIFLFFFKNEYFGADTKNYLVEFSKYCDSPSAYNGLDYTYRYTFSFLNFLMLGECNIEWLMWVWPLFIVIIFIIGLKWLKLNFLYLIVLFSSFIGIELLTNAMRQGFSIAILFLSFSFLLNKNKFLFFIFSFISIIFHQASIVIILIFIIARVKFKFLLLGSFIFIGIVFFSQVFDSISVVYYFKKSIYKYLPYAGDDFIIRIMAFLSLFVTYFLYQSHVKKCTLVNFKIDNYLFNVLFLCGLASIVPYLGFKVIYGIYPIFLLFCIYHLKSMELRNKFLSVLILFNATLSIVWLISSNYMRMYSFMVDFL